MDKTDANSILLENAQLIESELEQRYTDDDRIVGRLYEAQRYSLLSGGKRIRPSLCIETCRLFDGDILAALPFAVALEMVHTYSLIHDDLPCMDNDNLRRGKPTNHMVFGEGMATLAGDGLLTDAFLECAKNPYVSGDCAATAVCILSASAGSHGMVRGQAIDLYGEKNSLSFDELMELHIGKTGALISAAVRLGCLAAGIAPDDQRMMDMTQFALHIGLAFQVVDDILDVTSTEEQLGKPIGSDRESNKTTFMSFLSVDEARVYANECTRAAISAISKYENSERLIAIAEFLSKRDK